MKRSLKIILILIVFIVVFQLFTYPTFALTEKEVQEKIVETSKETVSGNIFVWFLCAMAFLKISQKIDSFMSSLGINVGHTGGNMLAEAMIATRGIGAGKQILSGSGGFGKSRSSFKGNNGSSGGFLSGGFAGAVNRHINQSVVGSATNQGKNTVLRNSFQNSMSKGGGFANGVIGTVAKGDIGKMGSITGDMASKAMTSYMGYAGKDNAPSYSDVEIGGGRISGTEMTVDNPQGIQFGMYNTEQYLTPEKGSYDIVTSQDGTKWYRQYATDTVEKTPYRTDEGTIGYHADIVQKLPPMPKRKDRV